MGVVSRGAWDGRPRVAGRALSQCDVAQTASCPTSHGFHNPEGGQSSALPTSFLSSIVFLQMKCSIGVQGVQQISRGFLRPSPCSLGGRGREPKPQS